MAAEGNDRLVLKRALRLFATPIMLILPEKERLCRRFAAAFPAVIFRFVPMKGLFTGCF